MPDEQPSWRILLEDVCRGDERACGEFWARYGPLVERVAAQHLSGGMRRRVGPESVVVSACRTFFRRAQQGEFEFAEADDVWRLLCAIAVAKIREKVRFHRRQKRGLDREVHAAETPGDGRQHESETADAAPSPAEIAEFNDQVQQLIASLEEDEQRVLELRLAQHTNEEIAAELGCSERTVRRMVKRIQAHLQRQLAAAQ